MKDLSLPSIDNSMCGGSPDAVRAKTPSTNSSSNGSQTSGGRIATAPQAINYPSVSARCWAICSGDTGEMRWGINEKDRREVASLTKVMTCYLVIRLVKKLPGTSFQSVVKVSKVAASMIGTTAELHEGDELTIWDLLHGLMLPSGNDAAWSLAEYFGKRLHATLESDSPSRNYTRYFVSEMNQLAKKLKLRSTNFDNPHGLPDPANRSNAKDLGKLGAVCMRNPRFREIVRAKVHSCVAYNIDNRTCRRLKWGNTNRLLDTGWLGIKTGHTSTAGPCLSSCFRINPRCSIVIILLNSKSMEKRWSDALVLANWASEQLEGRV